ncbi:class I SAM-dependent methyltransferase [Spirochaeta dissipatitropha]
MDRKFITDSNRQAWDEVMPLHRKAAGKRLDTVFSQPGYSILTERETELHARFGLQGAAIAHVACNNGQELMSLKNLGADRCVGFDISTHAIQEAIDRAANCGIPVEFVCTDVYDIDASWNGCFDKVYISVGCLGWMPDLPEFFTVCKNLLKQGGHIFIHEIHPIAEALPCDGSAESEFGTGVQNAPGPVIVLADRYFRNDPCVDQGGLDYVGGTDYESTTKQYWFVHTMSAILNSLKQAGFQFEFMEEYPEDISAGRMDLQKADVGLPLSWILVGKLNTR